MGYKGIDLFAGAGGMSLGAQAAGIEVVLAVENETNAAATYAKNHPDTEILNKDIREVEFPQVALQNHKLILFGGPPCQGFSTSNQRTRHKDNPTNWLFKEFIRGVRHYEPDWIVFENVRGIAETEGGLFLGFVKNRLSGLGYEVTQSILNAADFGVPQMRSRLFIVGGRPKRRFRWPSPRRDRSVNVEEAIHDLPELENGASENWRDYQSEARSKFAASMRGRMKSSSNHIVTKNSNEIVERYRHIPQGGNWESIPQRLMNSYKDRSRCHTGIYRRLRSDRPASVIGNFRKNMLIHPTQNRGLSVREAARLQSFPDSYEFCGSIGFQQQQVGNAVPPLLSEAVFKSITNL